jgi:hypothetical protein
VPDGVCVVWAGFLKELLEVVCRRPPLTLVAMHGGQDVPHARSTRYPIVAVVMVDRGCGPLRALLVPLFAALLIAVDGDVE